MLCSPIIKLVTIGREYCIDQYWVPLVGFSLIFHVKIIDRNWATRPLLRLFGQQRAVVHLRVPLLCCIHFSRSLFITHRERREDLIERAVAETTYIKECLGHQGTKHNGTADRRKCEALCSILCCGRGQDIAFLYWTFCSPQAVYPGSKEWVDFRVMGHWNCNSNEEQLMLRIRTDRRIGATK